MSEPKTLEERVTRLEGILEAEIAQNEKRPTETELIYRFVRHGGCIFFNETDGRFNAQTNDYNAIQWGEGFTIGGAIRDYMRKYKGEKF